MNKPLRIPPLSPVTNRKNHLKLLTLQERAEKQQQLIKAQQRLIDSYNTLFIRNADQHPDTLKAITFAQQNLSRCQKRISIFSSLKTSH